ncbi:MAG: hypothetical protein AB1793_02185 [Candidatus Thermoplasmatota archaeon]
MSGGRSKAGVRKGKARRSSRAARQSDTWEEHALRARAAVAVSTRRFIRENRQGIEESPSEEVASNSYVAGMLDMLSMARGTFGFWGADQVLDELERYNRKRSADGGRPRALLGPEGPCADGPCPSGEPQGPQPADSGAAPHKSRTRDPMFG